MMRKIIGNSIGHDMEMIKFSQDKDFGCTACAIGKLILRPSYLKIRAEPLNSLKEFKEIFVVQSNHYRGGSGTSWYR